MIIWSQKLEESIVAEPFREVPARSGIGRAIHSKRAITFEEIENLLGGCACVRNVSGDDVSAVCAAQGVDLERKYLSERKHLYRRYLAHCLEDKALSREESADLMHLRMLLRLSEQDVAAVNDEVAREVYGRAVDDVLADLEIDAGEEAFLRRLRDALRVSDETAANLLSRGRLRARDKVLKQASSPDRDFAISRVSAGDFTGRSDSSFEAAVADAIRNARLAMPRLHWFEIDQIQGYIGDGKPKGWHVTVRCGMSPGANN